MEEYRARMCHDVPGPGSTPKPKKVNLDQFALDNDISDMFDFSGSDLSSDEQDVDEEFLTYANAKFKMTKDPDNDILVFWEVSICTMHYHSRLGFNVP
jgi:hypothetical protein